VTIVKTRRILVLAGVVVAATVAVGAPAGAGREPNSAPLTIQKVVVGTAPPGTQFVVDLNCVTGSEGQDQVVFDEFGQPVGPNTVFFGGPNECTPTESQTGGAATVSYACEGTIPPIEPEPPEPPESTADEWPIPQGATPISDPCDAAGPQPEPILVFIGAPNQDATVTITNTFAEPAAVVVEPAFTG
jgi:hypothetical protein